MTQNATPSGSLNLPVAGRPDEERRVVERALRRMRPLTWSPGDPMNGSEVAAVLNVTGTAVYQAIKEGRLNGRREGFRFAVSRAALGAYITALIDRAEVLGVAVPERARALLDQLRPATNSLPQPHNQRRSSAATATAN